MTAWRSAVAVPREWTADVAGVEVTVHERVRDPACRDRSMARREPAQEPAQRGARGRVEPVGSAIHHVLGRRLEARGSPVEGAGAQQVLDPVGERDLCADEQGEHVPQGRRRGAIQVVTGDVTEQDPSALARQQRRDRARDLADQSEHPSCPKKGGTTLSQTGPTDVGICQMQDRFHVRICRGGPVRRVPRAARARSAQARSSPGPPGRAYD